LGGEENSVYKGYKEAVQKGFKNIHLMQGTHTVTRGYRVNFEHPMIVSGDGRGKTIVEEYGFVIRGPKDQKITFIDFTIQKTKYFGLHADNGMQFHCRRVAFDQLGLKLEGRGFGVKVDGTKGRLTNCQVTKAVHCGIELGNGMSCIELEGEETKISGNCTSSDARDNHGMETGSDKLSFIFLKSPLTKEEVSTKNGGFGNFSGRGIETVDEFYFLTESSWTDSVAQAAALANDDEYETVAPVARDC
jgi:hypothetical protein